MIRLPLILLFSAFLFSCGFSAVLQDVTGQIFALFVIAVAAAEVGIGLALVILLFRNRASINVDEADLLKW
jgi:NADH:ubiquinone oxidoreductase subunit K